MSYAIGDKYASLVSEWSQAITQYAPTWSQFAELVTDQGSTSLQRFADTPVAALQSWAGGDTEITKVPYGSTHEQTVALGGQGSRIVLDNIDIRMDSGLVERKAAELLNATQMTIESAVYSLLESTFTATIPSGESGGTTAICSDTHYYDANGDDATLDSIQSNKLSSALSYDGLSSAFELGMRWKNSMGSPMGLFRGPSTLVVSPKNRAVAAKLCDSAELLASGTSTSGAVFMGNKNPNQGLGYVVSSHLTADDDDWWLLDNTAAPIKVWVPFTPSISITENTSAQTVLTCSVWLKAFCDAPANGIIGANVA